MIISFSLSQKTSAGAKADFSGIHDWQASDQMRPLTDKGKKQAKAARDAWFAKDVVRTSNKVGAGAKLKRVLTQWLERRD